ncbi:adm isoform x1 [Lasius niger]|uniref:Adm isoform x1 n=1 Tax=Lasius niger TaxID=67767 RepID=A0A0J7JZS4_LASNI|nr:adm isoform x1 [Lasius niger]
MHARVGDGGSGDKSGGILHCSVGDVYRRRRMSHVERKYREGRVRRTGDRSTGCRFQSCKDQLTRLQVNALVDESSVLPGRDISPGEVGGGSGRRRIFDIGRWLAKVRERKEKYEPTRAPFVVTYSSVLGEGPLTRLKP